MQQQRPVLEDLLHDALKVDLTRLPPIRRRSSCCCPRPLPGLGCAAGRCLPARTEIAILSRSQIK